MLCNTYKRRKLNMKQTNVHKLDGFSLRRPISICGIDAENGLLRMVFEVRGRGTYLHFSRICSKIMVAANCGGQSKIPDLKSN